MTDAPASQHGVATMAATRPISRVRMAAVPDGLGGYRLYERLGTGGYATVYRARRIGEPDASDVALKRLHPHLTSDDEAIRAFGREARLAYLLDHPSIRRVYSLARESDELFMTMEYIDGVSLFDVLRRASAARCHLSLSGILALLHRLCDALHYAHELVNEHGMPAGFVHRDVSPSNIMIASTGRLKLIDMGVASARIDAPAIGSRSVKVQGKYGYMAPEVLERAPFDRRADVFSVGVVAWELLTLCRMYPVSKPPVDVELVRSRTVEVPSTYNPRCPAELDAIVMRAVARDPDARWPSCAAMAEALRILAIRLRESISDSAIADLIELAADPVTRPRLARGTSPPSQVVLPEHSSKPDTIIAPPPPPHCGRALALGGVGGSLATVLVATGIAHSSVDVTVPDAPAPVPVKLAEVAPPIAPVTVPPPPAVRAPVVEQPVRLEGTPPRSWSDAYPYRARLCIDESGEVQSVAVVEGPARLESRIVHALKKWRYAAVERPTCFEVRDTVERVTGR